MKNYYEILEVHPNASQEVIDKAYKTLVRKYHPDVQPKDKVFWAENKIKELTLAYETLSNKKQRDLYDLQTGLKDVSSYYEKYNNLSNKTKNLKEESNSLNSKKDKENHVFIKRKYLKGNYISYIKNLIAKESAKSPKERSKDLKAIILTIIIVTVIVFICIKVPFIKSILFPVGL